MSETPDLTPDELAFLQSVFDLARGGDADGLARHVDAGVPVNLTNSSGDTLLILAAYHSHPEAVDVLLARGAETDRANDRGQTALGAAVFRRCEPAVRSLLAAGADPDAGPRSATALATFFDLPDMLELLRTARPAPGGPSTS